MCLPLSTTIPTALSHSSVVGGPLSKTQQNASLSNLNAINVPSIHPGDKKKLSIGTSPISPGGSQQTLVVDHPVRSSPDHR